MDSSYFNMLDGLICLLKLPCYTQSTGVEQGQRLVDTSIHENPNNNKNTELGRQNINLQPNRSNDRFVPNQHSAHHIPNPPPGIRRDPYLVDPHSRTSGATYPVPCLQMSCSRIFSLIVMAANRPKGSKIDINNLRISRFVGSFVHPPHIPSSIYIPSIPSIPPFPFKGCSPSVPFSPSPE